MAIIGGSVVAIPSVDNELSTTSERPVQNKVVREKLGDLSLLTTSEKSNIVDAINEHDDEIGNLENLTTTDDGTLVEAINEIDSDVGNLNNLDTTEKDNLVVAINEVKEVCEKTSGVKISIPLTNLWNGSGPYTQNVTVSGYTVTDKTIVDLMAEEAVVDQLRIDGVEQIYISNNNATLVATVIGAKPSVSLTVNAIFSEVK